MTVELASRKYKSDTKAFLQSIYNEMIIQEDYTSADKIVDMYEKIVKDEFIISFTGHFSAGKSSIINYLLNKDVLPKSPIPTSANIVKISSGEGVARFHFKEAVSLEYDEPYDIDLVKEYATDKDTIKQIDISTSETILPENSVIMDTPGIDAADDADRLMTESALHTIDELYYVMDYNHVQSEVNMVFLKEMQAQEVPVHIIINQIDKHNDGELTLLQFQEQVKQTFDQWKIKAKTIYFTSAYDLSFEKNDIKQLKEDIFNKLTHKENSDIRFEAAIQQIIAEHEQFIKDKYELLADEVLHDFSTEDASDIEEIQSELRALSTVKDNVHTSLMDEVNLTLKNAYVMPAKLRDLAESFLIAEQTDFKVGFLQAKKKTAEERAQREAAFLSLLHETIDATIVWKLREKCNEVMHAYHLQNNTLQAAIESFTVRYNGEDLRSFMKRGAKINGNYILNYTNDISSDIKNKFRALAQTMLKTFDEAIEQVTDEKSAQLHEELQALEVTSDVIEKRTALEVDCKKDLAAFHSSLHHLPGDIDLSTLNHVLSERSQIEKASVIEQREKHHHIDEVSIEDQVSDVQKDYSLEEITSMIDHVTSTIEDSDGFTSLIHDLQAKKDKLTNRSLTIALFGAFSAGKSSFANAMLANKVLPVSPNPTTAVINRIHPVSAVHKHGDVLLHFKEEHVLYDDLLRMTSDFSPKVNNLEEMMEWIETNHIQHHKRLNNMYQAYLKAVLAGYDQNKGHIGNTLTISLEEFASFVTDESKACYLQLVDLYYDCPLTRKGITLVDTPGADSVNARHTNVSFEYIKEADAILYVTYYNHAVTSADRDFLMQLGRVKEAFELDKMFFIVNAADLAQTEADLELVLQYVEEQLVKLGIRQAKIFPLSSKLTLEEKLANEAVNDKMLAFEETFFQFIEKDLVALTVESALWDVERVQHSLKQTIEAASLPVEEKERYRKQLEVHRDAFLRIVDDVDMSSSLKRVQERIERQLHFVLERLYIRFHDMFAEYFNPTTIKASGREGVEQIKKQRNDFVHYVGYELLQEVRAVSLRLEAYMNDLLIEQHTSLLERMTAEDKHILLGQFERLSFKTANYEEAFTDMDYDIFTKAVKVFRNVKNFFEQNGREKMKDLFYEALHPYAEAYLDEVEKQMVTHYDSQWMIGIESLQETLIRETNEYIDHQLKVVTSDVSIADLEEKLQAVEKQLQNIS